MSQLDVPNAPISLTAIIICPSQVVNKPLKNLIICLRSSVHLIFFHWFWCNILCLPCFANPWLFVPTHKHALFSLATCPACLPYMKCFSLIHSCNSPDHIPLDICHQLDSPTWTLHSPAFEHTTLNPISMHWPCYLHTRMHCWSTLPVPSKMNPSISTSDFTYTTEALCES